MSGATRQVLSSLKTTLIIDAYVTRAPGKLDGFVRELRGLLDAYKAAAPSKVEYHVIEVGADDTKKALADKEGLKPVPDVGYMGLAFQYGTEKDVIPVLVPDNDAGLELWVTTKIRELHDRRDASTHKIGLLTGHDELKLSEANLVPAKMGKPSMQEVIARNFPFYTFVDVDLHGGADAIDASLDGLLVLQPGKPIEEKELRRIDEFVARGKALAVFASAVNVQEHDPEMHATLDTRGLDKLLDGWGIELHRDAVLDFGSSFHVAIATNEGVQQVHFPQLVEVEDDERFTGDHQRIDTAFPPFFRMEQLVLPFASSLAIHPEKQPDARVSVVARTTPQAVRKVRDEVDLTPFQAWRAGGAREQLAVAARVEGKLKSAFTGAISPPGARVFVLASSQFTANPFARAGNPMDVPGLQSMSPVGGDEKLLQIAGPYANLQSGAVPILYSIMVTKNTLDWMIADPALNDLSSQKPACR